MTDTRVSEFQQGLTSVIEELHKVIVGHTTPVEVLCAAFFSQGHVLIEGVPGLGKTLLSSSFAHATGLDYKKIQFTPDLMPADITGTNIIAEKDGKRGLEFREGPLFANIVLADEINRATPKTQSALLEGMQEKCVTSGRTTIPLPRPFMVIGTQNPVEMKGTYPLPEAQKDRFMFKVNMYSSNAEELSEILRRTVGKDTAEAAQVADEEMIGNMMKTVREVAVSEHIRNLASRILLHTDPLFEESSPAVKKYVRLGSSVRGGQALIAGAKVDALLNGQVHASTEGIRKYIEPALRHRLILNFEAGADEVTPDDILKEVAESAV